jgi:hypothetical protein
MDLIETIKHEGESILGEVGPTAKQMDRKWKISTYLILAFAPVFLCKIAVIHLVLLGCYLLGIGKERQLAISLPWQPVLKMRLSLYHAISNLDHVHKLSDTSITTHQAHHLRPEGHHEAQRCSTWS